MKKWYVWFLLVALISACSLAAYAAPGQKGHDQNGPDQKGHDGFKQGPDQHDKDSNRQLRADSRSVIQRTAPVLIDAQQIARRHHFRSGLAQAVAHQQMARDLYARGSYQNAIFHSLRAREIAIQIIQRNRGPIRRDYSRDQIEDDYYHRAPPAHDLDRSIIRIEKDDDALQIKIDINL